MAAPNKARDTDTGMGRIVVFPTRSPAAGKIEKPAGGSRRLEPRVADLRRYEQSAEPDDYARRMVINLAAFAVIVLLTLAGIWLADQLALLRKHSDCAFLGYKACAPSEAPRIP